MADAVCPHDHRHVLGRYHMAGEKEVQMAIDASRKAWEEWSETPWEHRAAVMLKAAELLAGPWRDTLNAACMLNQSKTVFQAEIDAACELIDFWRYNPHYMRFIYEQQPGSDLGHWDYVEYRALEGFVFAVTPFNFASIAGNLPTSPTLMGNTVLWKPASSAVYTAHWLMKLIEEAGLPPGVINLIPGSGGQVGNPVMASPHLAGVHFTGSTPVFQGMWRTVGENIASYRTYPRIVGETGGKASSSPPVLRRRGPGHGAGEGGLRIPGPEVLGRFTGLRPEIGVAGGERPGDRSARRNENGPTHRLRNFFCAVIDRGAFNDITGYIRYAKESLDAEIVAGGEWDDSEGFYIQPTVVLTTDPHFKLMEEEIFGPVLTIYVYDDADLDRTLDVCDTTSPYALTGAIFAQGRSEIVHMTNRLRHAAGNFYINDKPTGAVVGQQPFGGARASGTNDKAGSYLNLIRWTSQRTIKENFVPPKHFGYPFMGEE